MKSLSSPTRHAAWRCTAAMAVLAGALCATPALAQVGAAYVKNVDEAGRAPCQSQVDFNANSGCGGTANCSFVSFTAVPAGKRLVVQQLSLLTGVASPGHPTLVAFSNSPGCNSCSNRAVVTGWVNTGAAAGSGSFWALDRPAHLHFEAGEIPQVKMYATASFTFVGNATLIGYLIDANN